MVFNVDPALTAAIAAVRDDSKPDVEFAVATAACSSSGAVPLPHSLPLVLGETEHALALAVPLLALRDAVHTVQPVHGCAPPLVPYQLCTVLVQAAVPLALQRGVPVAHFARGIQAGG